MTDDEKALLTLADPILWKWCVDGDGRGHWQGLAGATWYRIWSPRVLNTFTPRLERLWVAAIAQYPEGDYEAPVPSEAQAKALCVHHAVTGDLTEIRALDAAGKAEETMFRETNASANRLLTELFHTHHPFSLHWQKVSGTPTFCATGTRGTYTATFDAEHYWAITRTRDDAMVETQRFLTFVIARLACALHSQTGQWHAML